MAKNLFMLVLLAIGLNGYAQDVKRAPDMKAIKKAVTDKSSALYYPSLLQRFRAADTTMTLSEKRHLYYGFSTVENYSPYGSLNYQDSIRTILKNETLIESDYVKLLTFTDSVLRVNPLNLRTLNYRYFAANKTGNTAIASLTKARIDMLLDAIMSTGDGKSTSTAYWVIEVSHEYFMLNVLGLEFGGTQSLTMEGPCDYLTVKENDAGLSGIYFNVSISFSALSEMFKDDKGKKRRK